jgi:DNA-binding response OmpR family regulator
MLQVYLLWIGFACCRYVHARSRAQALSYFREGNRIPDLVLLDASLPDASGLEVLTELRTSFSYQQLPIIMFTARQTERSIVAALEAGVNDYVAKPFRRAELLARIRMHLRGSSQQRTRMMWATGGMVLEGSESDQSKLLIPRHLHMLLLAWKQ